MASLAVTGQHFLAGPADLGAIGLQAAKNSEYVVWIDLKLGLTIPGHIRMAGGAFLWISLAHRRVHRWRLRGHFLGLGGGGRERKGNCQDRDPEHGSPLRHPARPMIFNCYPTFFCYPPHIKFPPTDSRHSGSGPANRNKRAGRGLGGHASRCSACEVWWAVTDSNRRHSACKADALPTELTARAA
jgi:hypothetical protein